MCVFFQKKRDKETQREKIYIKNIYIYKFSNQGVFFEIFWYPKNLWNFSCQNFRNFSQFLHTRKTYKIMLQKNFPIFFVQKKWKKLSGEKKRHYLQIPNFIWFFFFFFFSGDTNRGKYRVVNSLWCVIVAPRGWDVDCRMY